MRIRRRGLLVAAAGVALGGCVGAGPGADSGPDARPVSRLDGAAGALRSIAFGSCIDQARPAPVWDTIVAGQPDLFLFGGDNVYCELPYTPARMHRAYAQAAESPGMSRLRREVPHLAIWDDHDYGLNDGGAEFAFKAQAKAQFVEFWQLPPDDPRRRRDGLYHSKTYGPPGRRVQVILLDGRWFRSPLKRTDQRDAPGKERFVPDESDGATMLGETQWHWLEEQLRQPAQLRLVVSGVQVLAEGHGWERWGNFPRERQRLYHLIASTGAQGVVFLSGDRHIGALYRESAGTPYPLYELTSSGITHAWRAAAEAGPNRLGELFTENHYGTVDIDWSAGALSLSVRDVGGRAQRTVNIPFNQLKAQP